MPLTTPPIVTEPFAKNAASGYITNPIPLTSSTPGDASFDQGFPAVTMTPTVSGGVPPFGQDMNGILFMLSSHTAFLQGGQWYEFDAGVASAISGYALGTMLLMADGSGFWISTAANNSNNPDTGGANWAPVYSYGQTTISTTGGSTTLTAVQAAKAVIIVTGALTSNAKLVFPTTEQAWLIVNATTGAFTLNVNASGGSNNVAVLQGGKGQPLGVWGDGTNLYPSVAPLTVPIAQAATALTLAERNNTGELLATYFNQSSALENPSIGAIFVQNTAADGYLRKISPANLIAQLTLATNASALTAAKAAIVANGPAVRGGGFTCTAGTVSVTFSPAFTTSCSAVTVTPNYASPDVGWVVPGSITRTGFQYYNGNSGACSYMAAGA